MFEFNGISSDVMGVIVEEDNFISKAKQNATSYQIEGMDGVNIKLGSFNNVESSITVTLLYDNVDEVISWLQGKGTLVYDNRKTTIYFIEQIDYNRLGSKKTATLQYVRSPFWYHVSDAFMQVKDNYIYNAGNTYVYPVIRLVKNADTVSFISLNGVEFSYEFENESYVDIDCNEKSEIKSDNNSGASQIEIGYEYPVLYPGSNKIKVTGDCDVYVMRKDAWL